MQRGQVIAAVQKAISIMEERGEWAWLCKDEFWPKTHSFIVQTLSCEDPMILQEMNARYMAEVYFGVDNALESMFNIKQYVDSIT